MKTSLLSLAAAFALLTSPATFAAAPLNAARLTNPHPQNGRDQDDRDRKMTSAEKARMEAARRDNRNDKDFNYGYDKNHKVTSQERARWEAAHKDDRRDDRNDDRR